MRTKQSLIDAAENNANLPLVFVPTEYARRTIEAIRRTGESDAETVNRILETLCASAPDFDHFYGHRTKRAR